MPGYYVENFGCRATQADGAALERQFEQSGIARASAVAQASVVVLNTCTVTVAADQDARAAIRRVQRQNPDAKIVVTGCYAQRAPKEVAALPGVSIVIGNSHKHQLAEIALQPIIFNADACATTFVPVDALASFGQRPIFVSDIFAHTELLAAPVFDVASFSHEGERTRPNLKVQDGCDNRCSFCVIPYVRGQSRSLPLDRIIQEVQGLVQSGYREVVISGINLGRWGRDLGLRTSDFGPRAFDSNQDTRAEDRGLTSLIEAILADTTLEKLRISSVEPMDWSDELIDLIAHSPRIAKHAHVPMQSGSDDVLRRMHRKYRPWHYREKITKIRAAIPTAAIGADIMVGFPGETDAEFEATRQMVEELPFTYLHVFTYSARPGTPAVSMANQVPVHVARERNRVLRDLAAQKKLAFMRSLIGNEIEAITLRGADSAGKSPFDSCSGQVRATQAFSTEALTDNYLKLHLEGQHEPNRWVRVSIEGIVDDALAGRVNIS